MKMLLNFPELKNTILLTLFVLITGFQAINAQFVVKIQTAAGYSEHLSTGLIIEMRNHHRLTFNYGSNFFINTDRFESVLAGYSYVIKPITKYSINPEIGIKGGKATFTDTYYRWKIVEMIPYLGLNYNLNKRLQVFTEAGLLISHELSQVRIAEGEIGNYRTYLPEFRLGINFNLW